MIEKNECHYGKVWIEHDPEYRVIRQVDYIIALVVFCHSILQGGWGGWPTGNGKKVSNSQACCLAQLCLAAA